MSYMPGSQYFWITSDADPSFLLSGLFYWIHLFRMPLFFLIAGFFGHLAFHRLGMKTFVLDRFKRIIIPLVSAWPMIMTGIVLVIVWMAWLKFDGVLPKESPPGPKFTPDDFPLAHLWFLYLLSLLYIAILILRTLLAKLDYKGRIRLSLDATMRVLMRPGASLLLALPLTLGLYCTPKWIVWFGVPTPDTSLYPNIAAILGFSTAFLVGWGLHRQLDLLKVLQKYWHINLALAFITTSISIIMTGVTPAFDLAPQGLQKLAYAFSYSVASWSWVLALVGMSLQFMSGINSTRRYLADASYWMYIVHLPLVMALQVAASQVNWSWWVEFPLILVVGLALMLGSYELLVRHTFIGAILNGRKVPRSAKKAL